jgi:hypothetical protein
MSYQAQKKNPLRPRPLVLLNKRLTKNLKDYAVAATAAGVGMMVLSPSAEAKVVYTPANTVVGGPTAIDLNNDGVTDFSIQEWCCGLHEVLLVVAPTVVGNGIRSVGGSNYSAAAGFFGVPVGPGGQFVTGTSYLGLRMARAGSYGGASTWFSGPWANAQNRYLALKFLINGQVHYGWARLNVSNFIQGGAAVITGYAYETLPNKGLVEGHISGPAKVGGVAAPPEALAPTTNRASLGAMALGVSGLSIWRRDEESILQ